MGALAQIEASRFASLKAIVATATTLYRRRLARFTFPNHASFLKRPHLRRFLRQSATKWWNFTRSYFCQGGFRQVGMTFEQFLLVAAAIKPADLPATRRKHGLGRLNSSRSMPHEQTVGDSYDKYWTAQLQQRLQQQRRRCS